MDKIVAVLEGFFPGRRKIDVAVEAQRRGIPATPLLRPGEVLDNEHTTARGTFRTLPLVPGVEARPSSSRTARAVRWKSSGSAQSSSGR
jgi:crotonobetainyl-CoA:carnitine CoA-transferase CaiB-like acyl-CoA transferase